MAVINWYRIGSRVKFIESQLPQQIAPEFVEGLPVRVDLSSVETREGAQIININLVYDGYSIPARLRERGHAHVVDDKYGAVEQADGFIYLGVKSES